MPITPTTTIETFQTPEGKKWRLAGTDDHGTRYFVPAHLDPTKIRPSVWASETYLQAELGDLTPSPRPPTRPPPDDPLTLPAANAYATWLVAAAEEGATAERHAAYLSRVAHAQPLPIVVTRQQCPHCSTTRPEAGRRRAHRPLLAEPRRPRLQNLQALRARHLRRPLPGAPRLARGVQRGRGHRTRTPHHRLPLLGAQRLHRAEHRLMAETTHEHGPYYWNADSPHCKHGAEPDWNTSTEAHDNWAERHPVSDNGHICLDAPMGKACHDCSAEDGEYVPWGACRTREHARPKNGIVPNPDTEHQQVTVWVGPATAWNGTARTTSPTTATRSPARTAAPTSARSRPAPASATRTASTATPLHRDDRHRRLTAPGPGPPHPGPTPEQDPP
ncbi:hypothetical protein [Streptomyces microflavus]|uniref:hypothetical protein n=1 Tax=Streptomyces microflavus TaxID=1919 RepID=UPI003B223A37